MESLKKTLVYINLLLLQVNINSFELFYLAD